MGQFTGMPFGGVGRHYLRARGHIIPGRNLVRGSEALTGPWSTQQDLTRSLQLYSPNRTMFDQAGAVSTSKVPTPIRSLATPTRRRATITTK